MYPVSVVDAEPAQQGGTAVLTTSFTVRITNAAPALLTATPATFLAGSPAATVAISGDGFTPGTTATLNGTAHPLIYQDPQHLQLALTAADLLYAQTYTLVLTNAAPGGGSTTPATLVVTNYTKAAQQYSAYGDSITFGYQLAATSSAYPSLLAKANGLALTNLARVGDQACDTFIPLSAQRDGYAAQPNTIFTYMIGTNDTYVKGNGAYEANFNRCDRAVLTWLGLPALAKVQPGNAALQVSGGCANTRSAARYGVAYCASAGAIGHPAFVTYGAPIYLWLLIDDNAPAGASMRLTVDGSTIDTYPVAPTPAIKTLNGATSSIALVRVPVAAGTHAITLTASGQGAGLLGIGTVPASRAGLPAVVVGDVPWQRTYSPVATVDVQQTYSADVRANVALLQGDGLDLRFAPDRSTMLGVNEEMADALHPNVLGQQHLQTAFQTGFLALNATGGLVAQLARGTTPLPAQAIVAVAPAEEGANYQLPSAPGGLLTVANRSATHTAVLLAPAGESLSAGPVSVGPGAVVTLRSVPAVQGPDWQVVRSWEKQELR